MKKREFERALMSRLKRLPQEERDKALGFYNELYWDRREHGEDESTIIESFGTPEEVAARLLADFGLSGAGNNKAGSIAPEGDSIFTQTTRKVKENTRSVFSNRNFLILYFALFFVTFPLTIAVLSVVFSLGIAVLSFAVAFVACGIAFIICGPVVLVLAPILEGGFTPTALAAMGCALVLFAVGILLIKSLAIFNWLRILIFVKPSNRKETAAKHRCGKKVKVGSLIVAAIAIVAGGALFAVGFAQNDWDFHGFDAHTYEHAGITLDEPVNKISIDVLSRNVEIIAVTTDFRVEAYNYSHNTLTITFEGGILTIAENHKFNIRDIINFFGWVNHEQRNILIYVPAAVQEINAELTSGDMKMTGITAQKATIASTSGNVRLENSALVNVKITVTSGNVTTTSLVTTDIDVRVFSGNVSLQIKGKREDYNIESSVTSGTNKAGSHHCEGEHKIFLKSTSGNLNLSFV